MLNWPQPQVSQRMRDDASQSAHPSISSRYHQMETERQPGSGSALSAWAWYHFRMLPPESLP